MPLNKIKPVTEEEWESINKFNKRITNEFLKQGHLSYATLEQYKSGLRIFFRWVSEEYGQDVELHELKPRHALAYQNWLIEHGLSSSAIKFKRSAVSSLCGFLELYYNDEFPMFRNIFNKAIPTPAKNRVHEKQPLTLQEYGRLLGILRKRKEWQMLAYVQFSYSSGCRRAEAVQLLKEVVNYNHVKGKDGKEKNYFSTHSIRCKGRGREGKVRKLQFDDDAMLAIKRWLVVRGEDDCPYVFVSKKKDGTTTQLSASTFNQWCHGIFSEIVGRRVHPHMFRSTRATHLVEIDGKDIKSAQKLLGHESSNTTEIYVVRDESEDLDDAFD